MVHFFRYLSWIFLYIPETIFSFFCTRKCRQCFHKSNCTVISNTINEGNAWPSNKRYLKTEKKRIDLSIGMSVLPLCVYVRHVHACFPWRPEEGVRIPGPFARAAIVLSLLISLAPVTGYS